jgi:outer membrane protein assembly factor BamB
VWEFDAQNPIVSSPVMMDELLVVADESGTVHVFDLNAESEDNAMPLRHVPPIDIGAPVKSSFCAHEGLVYIRGEDNRIYVVDIDQGRVSWEFALGAEE